MVVAHRSGMHDGPTRRPIVHEPGSATGPCSAGSNPGGHGLPIPALKGLRDLGTENHAEALHQPRNALEVQLQSVARGERA